MQSSSVDQVNTVTYLTQFNLHTAGINVQLSSLFFSPAILSMAHPTPTHSPHKRGTYNSKKNVTAHN